LRIASLAAINPASVAAAGFTVFFVVVMFLVPLKCAEQRRG